MDIKGSPSWELRTASSRGRYGEYRQRDPCLKHTYKNTTSFQEGPGLSPNNAGVLAHLGLGIRDGH